jgi:hypothetical protein
LFGNLKGGDYSENLDGMIILECVDWIHLIQEGGKWQVLVNTVTNLQVP